MSLQNRLLRAAASAGHRRARNRPDRRGCARLILTDRLRHAIVRPAAPDTGTGRKAAGVCWWGGLSDSFDGVDSVVALITGANKGIGKETAR